MNKKGCEMAIDCRSVDSASCWRFDPATMLWPKMVELSRNSGRMPENGQRLAVLTGRDPKLLLKLGDEM